MQSNQAIALAGALLISAGAWAKEAQHEEVLVLEEINVFASPVINDYAVPRSSVATRTNAPLMETPVSVQIIPEVLLDDQQAINLDDVYKNVSGMQADYGFGNWDAVFMRGFSSMEGNQNSASYRNGQRSLGRGGGLQEMSNIERVEVLKGPASVLYGRIEPGGLINIVTKKPQAASSYELQQQVGSYDFYRTTVDATGAIDKNNMLLYRIDGAAQKTRSFRDVMFSDYYFVAPSFTLKPNDDLEINFGLEHRRAEGPGDYGVPAQIAGVSRRLWVGDKTDDAWLDKDTQNLDWSYQLNDRWQLRNSVGLAQGKTRYNNIYITAGTFNAATGDLQFSPWVGTNKVDSQSVTLELDGKFEAVGTKHELLVGADHMSSTTRMSYFTNGFGALAPVFNIFKPVYGFIDYTALNAQAPDFLNSWNERWHGVYVQDQVTIADKLHLLVGGRYDWTDTSVAGTFVAANTPHTRYNGFKPRIAALYQTAPWLSLYGSYTESVGALNGGTNAAGDTFQPEQAKQYETGIKTETPDGRLSSTLAWYHITKNNVLTPDPAQGAFFNVASGEVRSQGIELDVAGKVGDKLDITANYAYTDVEITRDLNGFQGKRPADVAKNTANLWAKYAVSEQWTVGGGVYLVGARYGDSLNTFKLSGYGRVDAMAAYHFNYRTTLITAQLNINNLLDKDYLANTVRVDTTPDLNIIPGAPRTAYASLKLEF